MNTNNTSNHHYDEKQPALEGGTAEHSEFLDLSLHPLCWLVSCPFLHCGLCPYRTVLYLESTAVTRQDVSFCGQREIYVPYNEIQSIEQSRCCCCVHCVDVQGGLGTFLPGMGCWAGKCRQTVQTLQQRVQQTSRQQTRDDDRLNMIQERTLELTEKMDHLLQHLTTPGDDGLGPPLSVAMTDRRDE